MGFGLTFRAQTYQNNRQKAKTQQAAGSGQWAVKTRKAVKT
jgi:hypothetical protein